ncbi:MAG: hypothetical protein JO069_07915 [Verrucomicrobia bacterium]|nr:hypothetical protein [Verrucomicrobiota bacterium]
MNEWVLPHLAGVGDVIEHGGQPAVITRVGTEPDGTGVILAIHTDGAPRRWEWRPGLTPRLLSRLGRHCRPTPEGLRDFLAWQVA